MNPNFLSTFTSLAFLSPLLLFFGQIRAFLGKVFAVIIIKVEMEDTLTMAFIHYLKTHGKRWPLGHSSYNSAKDFSQVDNKRIVIGYETIAETAQLLKLGRSILLAQSFTGNNKSSKWSENKLTLYYLRGTFNHEKAIIDALDHFNARDDEYRFLITLKSGEGNKVIIPKDRDDRHPSPFAGSADDNSKIYKSNRILKYELSQLGYRQPKATVYSGYVFCHQAKKVLYESQKWLTSESWYRDHGILWRKGILIGGVPGSGKSSLVRKICQILDLPLFIFDLSSMSNKEFINGWMDCQNSTPCCILFDDIDKVFDKQKNIAGKNGGGLSFDSFINALSGAQPSEGMLVFCTANDMSKIDDTLAVAKNGLASRPGRIDCIIEINKMEKEDRFELAKQLFQETSLDIDKAVEFGEGMTAAQFNNYCSNLALDSFSE